MPKTIIVDVNNDGRVKVETNGFKGESCVSGIKELLAGFFEVDNFDYKSDYYEEEIETSEKVSNSL